jgi:hypothetical protein
LDSRHPEPGTRCPIAVEYAAVIVRTSHTTALRSALESKAHLAAPGFDIKDGVEGVTILAEKREPLFTGELCLIATDSKLKVTHG